MNMGPAAKAARQKKFALECREVRLFIAANPGTNHYAIKERFGRKPDRHLSKMVGMGIIRTEGIDGPYYVVPQ